MQFTSLSGVINHSLSTVIGSVAMPAGKYCKGMIIRTRNNTPFRIYPGSGISEPYFSVSAMDGISVELSGTPNSRIFWSRTETGTDILEILLFNA